LGVPLFERKIEKIEDCIIGKIESLLMESFVDFLMADQPRDKGSFQPAITLDLGIIFGK
jgi:hypothetical protein